jgi:glutathione peroxidase
MEDFYILKARSPQGNELPMSAYKGNTVLVVNTATRCGLAPQFRELEELHQKYKDRGLVILGFPSNQFLNQEPESNQSMEESCMINFGVTFQLTEKIKVNGAQTHPVFTFLKDQLAGKLGKRITWNFTKFLITPDGIPYKRYEPRIPPAKLEKDIQALLPEPASDYASGK